MVPNHPSQAIVQALFHAVSDCVKYNTTQDLKDKQRRPSNMPSKTILGGSVEQDLVVTSIWQVGKALRTTSVQPIYKHTSMPSIMCALSSRVLSLRLAGAVGSQMFRGHIAVY